MKVYGLTDALKREGTVQMRKKVQPAAVEEEKQTVYFNKLDTIKIGEVLCDENELKFQYDTAGDYNFLVGEFEEELMAFAKSTQAELLTSINASGNYNDEIEASLHNLLKTFMDSFEEKKNLYRAILNGVKNV